MLFKEGDIITGTKYNDYGITNEEFVMKVDKTFKSYRYNDRMMRVEIIKPVRNITNDYLKNHIGEYFSVLNCSKRFRYFNSSIKKL